MDEFIGWDRLQSHHTRRIENANASAHALMCIFQKLFSLASKTQPRGPVCLRFELNLPQVSLWRQAALANTNLLNRRIHATELRSLITGEFVHRGQSNIHPRSGMIDGRDEDTLAFVCDLVAIATLSGVPAWNGYAAADEWK